MGGRARHSVRAAIAIQPAKVSHAVAIQILALKKHIMQVPVFTICYVRSQSAQAAGRVATGFPLPSTGRGIEGEGWSYPEPPPVRFFLDQHHPASELETVMNAHPSIPHSASSIALLPLKPEPFNLKPSRNPRNITIITVKHPVHNYTKHHRHPMISPPFHPGGIPACSRWLSEAIPPESNPAASRTPAGVPAIDLTARESFVGSHPSTNLFHAHSWAKKPE